MDVATLPLFWVCLIVSALVGLCRVERCARHEKTVLSLLARFVAVMDMRNIFVKRR